jgi:PAS domain S-box-containing protein
MLNHDDATSYATFILDAFGAADYEVDLTSQTIRPSVRLNKMLGYPPDHRLSLPDCQARCHAADLPTLMACIRAALTSDDHCFQCETRLLLPDGSVRWVLSRGEIRVNAYDHQVVRGALVDITERKQAELTQQQIESYQRAILDNAHQSVMLIAPDYRLLLFNRYAAEAAREVFGCSMVVGQSILNYVTQADYPAFQWHFQQALAGQQVQVEKKIASDFQAQWWEFFYYPILQPDGTISGVAFTCRIITERKQAEMHLRQSEARAKTLIRNLPGGAAFVLDHNLRYVMADGMALEDAGMRGEDLLGKTIFEVLEPKLADRYKRFLQQVLNGVPFQDEHHSHKHWYLSRGVPLYDEAGAIEAALIVSYDITQRKLVEETLRERDRSLAVALRAARAGLASLDLATGIGVTTPEWCDVVGLAPPPTPQTFEHFLALVHPDDRPWVAQMHQNNPDVTQGLRFEFRILHPQRGERWIASQSEYLPAPDGGLGQLIGIAIDITDRKRVEEATRISEARQTFLLALSDALRPLVNPVAIQDTAARLLGDYLAASRVLYGEMDVDGEYLMVDRNFVSAGQPLLLGRFRVHDFGKTLVKTLTAGNMVIIPNIPESDILTAQERAAYAKLGVAALIGVPLVKSGRFVANLNVHQAAPRNWTPLEIALVQETAERTWAAVERARIEEALYRAYAELELRVAERTAALATSNQALQVEIAQRREAEQAQQAVLRQLVTAQEDERLRIARDLHDQLGQQIAGLQLGLKQLEYASTGTALNALLTPLQELALEMAKSTHRFAVSLRPTILDDIGLLAALERLVSDWGEQTQIKAEFQRVGLPAVERFTSEIETALFRIVQEALTNVHKHANASLVSVIIERREAELVTIIEDNGRGYDAEAVLNNQPTTHLGLRGMRERVALLSGTLEIESTLGSGTTIFVRIPLATFPADRRDVPFYTST